MISYSPGQELRTFWERALIPIVYWRLSQRFPFDRVNDARSADAAANGQFILIRREAYEAIGGHAAIAAEILEDVALARRAKEAGFRIFFGAGQGIVRDPNVPVVRGDVGRLDEESLCVVRRQPQRNLAGN